MFARAVAGHSFRTFFLAHLHSPPVNQSSISLIISYRVKNALISALIKIPSGISR